MPENLSVTIKSVADSLFEKSTALRRRLHQIPETAWQETKTARELSRWLSRCKIDHKPVAGTGIIAEIKSGQGKCVAIRSDIDALPITEETDYPFISGHAGRMHACGHDIHMAVVSTTAAILNKLKGEFAGQVKILFQPAEEEPPGGAIELIKAGVMRNPKVEMIFGLHVNPDVATGKIGVRDGVLMAGVLDFDIEITGTGGHGALPHKTQDPLVCAAALIQNLQTVVSRNTDPFESVVVTVGKIEGGSARNVIPPSCRLLCTARALKVIQLKKLRRRIEMITKNTARSFGCQATINYFDGYPPLVNVKKANRFLRGACCELFGAESITELPTPYMGGEDFARYLEHAPGAMFHLGIRDKKSGSTYGWHHPMFKADEAAIPLGASVLAKAVIDFLND